MSADNGYVIRENAADKYVFQQYFASEDEYPPIDDDRALVFDTLQEAVDFYGRHMHATCASEYGLKIDIDFKSGKLYPLLNELPLEEVGIHLQLVDEQKKENKMQLKQFTRKPLVVEGVQVTEENIEEVAEWCDGEIHTEPKGRYIKVKVQNPLTPRQTKAFVGDWVLSSKSGHKVYTESGLQNAFSPEEVQKIDPTPPEDAAIHFTHPRTNLFDQAQETQELRTVDPSDQISGKQ